MALDQSALLELLEVMRSADDGELMRRLLGTIMQALVDAEASAQHRRRNARVHRRPHDPAQRHRRQDRHHQTTAGELTAKIPQVRTGLFFPALLATRRRIDVALHAVVMQAYVNGVSTRRVDDLVVVLGGTGINKSEVSRICASLDTDVAGWSATARPKASGPSSCARCATAARRVQLVISDSHRGLTNAIATVLQGAAWQRRVHFMRKALAKVSKGHAEMVAATIRTIFASPPAQPSTSGRPSEDTPVAMTTAWESTRPPRRTLQRQRSALPVRGVHGAAQPARSDRPRRPPRPPERGDGSPGDAISDRPARLSRRASARIERIATRGAGAPDLQRRYTSAASWRPRSGRPIRLDGLSTVPCHR